MKFKALVYACKLGEAAGVWVTVHEKDGESAHSRFCKYIADLSRRHNGEFTFSHFHKVEK